ncbi:hypothetical protein [Rubritalea tangerina]
MAIVSFLIFYNPSKRILPHPSPSLPQTLTCFIHSGATSSLHLIHPP